MLVPSGLLPFYPYPSNAEIALAGYHAPSVFALLLSVSAVFSAFRARKAWPAVLLSYAVLIAPVLGIMQVGGQVMADRYTYLPSLGPFILAGMGAGRMVEGHRSRVVIAAAASVLTVFALQTVRYTSAWADGEALWSHQIRTEGNSYVGYLTRGSFYSERGDFDRAVRDLSAAISLVGDRYTAYVPYLQRGAAYARLGRYDEAVSDLGRAASIEPGSWEPLLARGNVLAVMGRHAEALKDYDSVLRLDRSPDATVLHLRGRSLMAMGRYEEALADFDRAIASASGPPGPYYMDRAEANERLGRRREAAGERRGTKGGP